MTNILSTLPSRSTVVTSTPIVCLPGRLSEDFAFYLEKHESCEVMLEQQVVDSWLLKNPASGDFLLDLARLSSIAPDAVWWLKQRYCHTISGCRVEWGEESTKDTLEQLLLDYEGDTWEDFGYTLIEASAVEISIALELRDCPCLLQLELPGASYLDIPVAPWKRLQYPHK